MFGAGGFLSRDGWCLAGGRGCLLKGPHQIPGTSGITSFLVSSSRYYVYKILSTLFQKSTRLKLEYSNTTESSAVFGS